MKELDLEQFETRRRNGQYLLTGNGVSELISAEAAKILAYAKQLKSQRDELMREVMQAFDEMRNNMDYIAFERLGKAYRKVRKEMLEDN